MNREISVMNWEWMKTYMARSEKYETVRTKLRMRSFDYENTSQKRARGSKKGFWDFRIGWSMIEGWGSNDEIVELRVELRGFVRLSTDFMGSVSDWRKEGFGWRSDWERGEASVSFFLLLRGSFFLSSSWVNISQNK